MFFYKNFTTTPEIFYFTDTLISQYFQNRDGTNSSCLDCLSSDLRYYTTGSNGSTNAVATGNSCFEYEERHEWNTATGSVAAHPKLQGLRDLYDLLSWFETDFMEVNDDGDTKSALNSMNFVSPFAAAVCSPDVDARTTGAGLSALHMFIVYGFIGGHNDVQWSPWNYYSDASITVVAQCISWCLFEVAVTKNTGGKPKTSSFMLNPTETCSGNDGGTQGTAHNLPQFLLQPRHQQCLNSNSTTKSASVSEKIIETLITLSSGFVMPSRKKPSLVSRHSWDLRYLFRFVGCVLDVHIRITMANMCCLQIVEEANKPNTKSNSKDKTENEEPALVAVIARLAAIADPLTQEDDTCVLSLSLINIALETMNDIDSLASKHAQLLSIMQNGLCRNLLRLSTSSNLFLLGLAL
ncbi:LOW QUALITY PROTEIN: hypothetical protein HJC23_007305 [Cyclotella cryptica]|uniref:Uncharacterized protein n=1 Tax=Cyclotella cryptica TaxID=29204 RepID=A0ABD3P1N1_9STRA